LEYFLKEKMLNYLFIIYTRLDYKKKIKNA